MTKEEDKQEEQCAKAIEIVTKVLEDNNIKMNIKSCGCCQGVWVTLEKDGEMIADHVPEFEFDMIRKDKK